VKRQEEEKRRKLAEEEETELKRHAFKAKPMPKSVYPEYRNKSTPEKPQGKKKMEPQGKQKVDTTPSNIEPATQTRRVPIDPHSILSSLQCVFLHCKYILVQLLLSDSFGKRWSRHCLAFNGT
jgi:hypothetical protein